MFKNYCPISLLPICGKIFEKLIFDEMLQLILRNQLGFKPLLLMKYINHLMIDLKLEMFF